MSCTWIIVPSTMVPTKFHSTSFPSQWQLLWSSFSSFVVTRSSPPNNLFLFHILFSPLFMSPFPCVRSLRGHHLFLLLLLCILLFLLGCFIFFCGFHCFLFLGSFCCCCFFFFCKELNSSQHSCFVVTLSQFLRKFNLIKMPSLTKMNVHIF
jgi:hypothetical protein